jgi:hypothetical protein
MHYQTARLIILMASMATVVTLSTETVYAQRPHPIKRAGIVFVGGYYYDPFFGPYPWWPRAAYQFPYYPIDDHRAVVRMRVVPKQAAVYVDGFYAGIVDDFDGFFQQLPLPPGPHEIVAYLEGYRTVHRRMYLAPGSTVTLHETMECLPPGETSERPAVAPPLPPPPVGSFLPPRTPRPVWTPPSPPPMERTSAITYGMLSLRVQPSNADVRIDGERWSSSDGEHFALQLSTGAHRIDVSKSGCETFSTEIEVRYDDTTKLNVSLTPLQPRWVVP